MTKKATKKAASKKSSTSLVKVSSYAQKLMSGMGIVMLEDTETHQYRMNIRSESSNRLYLVSQRVRKDGDLNWECSCPGWVFSRKCKHLTAMAPVLEAIATTGPVKPIAAPKKRIEAPAITGSTQKKGIKKDNQIAPDDKDIKRIQDIIAKANGDDDKILSLCQTMAKSIKDADKAQRRAMAAKSILPKSVAKKAYDIFWQD